MSTSDGGAVVGVSASVGLTITSAGWVHTVSSLSGSSVAGSSVGLVPAP
jgi:hypothetical protein